MKQSQGRVELRRAGQSPNPGPLSGAGISTSQSVDAFGNLAQHMPEADVESPRGLVQKTELSELLEFNFFFLILVFAESTLNYFPVVVSFCIFSVACQQKNRILTAGLCGSHLVLDFPFYVVITLPPHRKPKRAAE